MVKKIYRYISAFSCDNEEIIQEKEVKKVKIPLNKKYELEALLNNCVDDDEAILLERELEYFKEEVQTDENYRD